MDTAEYEFIDHNEPVYLLSLDGGGVRGISEAVILHEIMTRIQKELGLKKLPKPCDYFHLIGGTSTGGLIAIMLGRLRMSTAEVLDQYNSIAETIFSRKNRRVDRSFGEEALEQAIKDVAKPRINGNPHMALDDNFRKGQSFVVSLRKGSEDENTPTIFRSYECQGEKTECEIWEAARATTAAPSVFKPVKIKVGIKHEYFIDGAVGWNNPSLQVLSEAEALFGPHRRLGCMVSLGTGLRPPTLYRLGKGRLGTSYSISEMVGLASKITDPEPPHRQIDKWLQKHPDSYFRFSVPYVHGQSRVRIFEYKKMETLRLNTQKYLADKDVSDKLDEIVDILCRKRATDLTLYSACHANTPETNLEATEHLHAKHAERKTMSPVFTGRGDVLRTLGHVFAPRDPGSSPRRDFWLWGMGGVGKSQIALRFIDLFADRFDKVLWVDASDISTIHYSFEDIASQVLQHPGEAPHIRPVLNWLNNTKEEWLLVIDNYDGGDITRYLPGPRKGNILFTSRRHDLKPQMPLEYTLQVSEMSISESTCLFLRACRMDEEDERLQEEAYPVIEELGGLPMGLVTAGANIYMRACTFNEFLSGHREERSRLLSEAPPGSQVSKNPSLYATFELSFERIKSYSRGSSEQARISQSALQILNTFCFYHRENIPLEIIVRANAGIRRSKNWNDIGLTAEPARGRDTQVFLGICGGDEKLDCNYILGGLALLVRFSLIIQPEDARAKEDLRYSIQPLMHSYLRDRMRPGRFDENLRLARTVLYHSYNRKWGSSGAEKFYLSLLPHMKANDSHRFKCEDKTSFDERMEIRRKYIHILERAGLWDESISILEEDVESFILELDHSAWETLDAMVELSKAYMATGRIIEAEGILQEVHDRLGDCPRRAWAKDLFVYVRGELSMVYLVEGNFASAQLLAEAGIRYGASRGVGPLAPTRRLCLVYQYVGMWEDALRLAEKIFDMKLLEKAWDPTHHGTLRAGAELACIRARLGDVDASERVLADVARKFEAAFGKDHYDTLVARTNLAWIYFTQHRLGEAEVIQREVLETGRSVLGSHHLYTLYMMLRLGLTLGESGKYEEAIEMLDECVQGRIDVLGEIHPAVGGAHVWRSVFLSRMEGYDYVANLPEADVKMLELGMRYAENPYMAVQI